MAIEVKSTAPARPTKGVTGGRAHLRFAYSIAFDNGKPSENQESRHWTAGQSSIGLLRMHCQAHAHLLSDPSATRPGHALGITASVPRQARLTQQGTAYIVSKVDDLEFPCALQARNNFPHGL